MSVTHTPLTFLEDNEGYDVSRDAWNRAHALNVVGGGSICRISTGQYTGDGTRLQSITGLGFSPKWVRINKHLAADANTIVVERNDFHNADRSFYSDPANMRDEDFRLIAFGVDGFDVDDGAVDGTPNTLGQLYDFVALG